MSVIIVSAQIAVDRSNVNGELRVGSRICFVKYNSMTMILR